METSERQALCSLGWNCLQEELMIKIVKALATSGNSKTIASLRLVSKAWLAAVRELPTTPKHIEVIKCGDLRKLCQIIPKIAQLTISSKERKINLRPLSSLTSLSRISIYGYDYGITLPLNEQLFANLSHLPSSLAELQLLSVEIRASCLRSLQMTNLRMLTIQLDPCRIPPIWDLLQCLPSLEALHMGGTTGNSLDLIYSFPLESTECCLVDYKACNGPPDLRQVYLNNVELSTAWLNGFTSTIAGLSFLQLYACDFGSAFGAPLQPISTLRSLVLHCVDLESQSDLAADSLPSLSLRELTPNSSAFTGRAELSRLTGLTRLEMVQQDIGDDPAITTALRNLQLRELVLLNCKQIELKPQLFVPGALTTLTALHIEDATCSSYRAESLQPVPASKREELKKVGDAIFRLPQLQQLSGWCDLFAIGMKQGLKSWEKCALPEGTMVTDKLDHTCCLSWMKVWTKPQGQ